MPAATDILGVTHPSKATPGELIIRFSSTKTWSFTIDETENLGPTLKCFSDQCGLARDALAFRENFLEINDVDSQTNLDWNGVANVEALHKADVRSLKCAWSKTKEKLVLHHGYRWLVLRSERLEPFLARIRAKWTPNDKEMVFCYHNRRVFEDDTADSLNMRSSAFPSTMQLLRNPVDIHFHVIFR